MKQGIPQYNDIRHQMSRSTHHRVKRNQKMIEAQRLLENHVMTDNSRHKNRKFIEKSNVVHHTEREQLELGRSIRNTVHSSVFDERIEKKDKEREQVIGIPCTQSKSLPPVQSSKFDSSSDCDVRTGSRGGTRSPTAQRK